jgi:hypothetical protein
MRECLSGADEGNLAIIKNSQDVSSVFSQSFWPEIKPAKSNHNLRALFDLLNPVSINMADSIKWGHWKSST